MVETPCDIVMKENIKKTKDSNVQLVPVNDYK